MGTKKSNKLYAAAAALAVTASAVAPGLTADAASKVTVKSVTNPASISHYGGYTFAVKKLSLPKTVKVLLSNKKYENRSVKWGKVSYDAKYIGKYQTISGTVSGTTKKASIKVKLNNYPVDVVEPMLAPVAVGEKLNLPSTIKVKYKNGSVVARSAKSFNLTAEKTDKAGMMKLSYNYMGNNSSIKGSIAYEVKAAEITNVMNEIKDDMLSVSADVKYPAKDAKAEVLVYALKDMTKEPIKIAAELKDGKLTAKSPVLPDGTHAFVVKVGDVVSPAKDFVVEAPMVKEVKAINLKQIEVTLNKDVDKDLASLTANYELKKADNTSIAISSAEVVDGKKVILTLNTAQAQSLDAKLTVKNLKDSKGKNIAEVTKDVKFLDVVAPTVGEIKVVAPRVVRVYFSEPLTAIPAFKLNNGATTIVSTQLASSGLYADLTIGLTPENGSSHTLNIVGGSDFATFKVESVDKSFVYNADTTAPTATLEVLSSSQVKVKFNEDVTNLNDANVDFYHTTKASSYKLTKGTISGNEITLTLPSGQKLPEGPVKVIVDYSSDNGTQIQDTFGNKFAEVELSGSYVADKTAPTVTNVEGKSSNTIDVTFSEEVIGGTNVSNYALKDSTGETVAIQNVTRVDASKNIYRVTTTNQLNGGSYNLSIKGVEDTSGNKLADVTKSVTLADTVRPQLASNQVQLLSSKKVQINFSEVMDKASIENKANYLFGSGTDALDSKVKLTASNNNKSVILDFTDVESGPQTTPNGASIQVLRVADVAGNLILAPTTTVTVPANATAPLFDKAEVTGKNSVKLYFKEVITNAEADDFLVKVGSASATAAVNLSNEVVDGKSVITLTTSNGVNGDMASDLVATPVVISTASAATVSAVNGYGTKVALTNVTGADVKDKFAASITNAVFADDAVAANDDLLVLTFSENLYAASVQESDFAVNGRTIKSLVVSNNTVTLTLSSDSSNTSVLPATVSIVGSIEDLARNAKTAQTFELVTPAAPNVTLAQGSATGETAFTNSTTAMEYSKNGAAYTSFTASNQSIPASAGDVFKVRTKKTSSTNTSAVTTLTIAASDIK